MKTIVDLGRGRYRCISYLSLAIWIWVGLIAVGCTTPVPKATPELPKKAVQAELEMLSAPAGPDDVRLRFTLTNVSRSPLYVLQWYTPLEGIAGEIFQVQHSGQMIPYEGALVMRDVPLLEEYVLLEPGQSTEAEVNLAKVYNFSRPGEYSIKFISPRISRLARSQEEIAQAVDDLGPVEMPANTVRAWLMPELDYTVRRTTAEAAQMIYGALLREHQDLNLQQPLPLEELPLPGLWESLRVQLFRMVDGPMANETYLINGHIVLPLGTAVGGQGLTSLEVDDLDEDGREEIWFTYSFGSGLHQSRIGVYAPDVDGGQYFELDRAFLGDWSLFRDDAGQMCVRAVEAHRETLSIAYLDTMGCLKLATEDAHLDPTLEIDSALGDDMREKVIHVSKG
ncbi:MAG: hypothetical protein R3293_21275 [Candidatus Promineifilaceae bacterium]|nr:hypothetical protein [Candidatus Promineifilaceae bacterium]